MSHRCELFVRLVGSDNVELLLCVRTEHSIQLVVTSGMHSTRRDTIYSDKCKLFFLLSCIIVRYFYSCLWHVSGIALCLLFLNKILLNTFIQWNRSSKQRKPLHRRKRTIPHDRVATSRFQTLVHFPCSVPWLSIDSANFTRIPLQLFELSC